MAYSHCYALRHSGTSVIAPAGVRTQVTWAYRAVEFDGTAALAACDTGGLLNLVRNEYALPVLTLFPDAMYGGPLGDLGDLGALLGADGTWAAQSPDGQRSIARFWDVEFDRVQAFEWLLTHRWKDIVALLDIPNNGLVRTPTGTSRIVPGWEHARIEKTFRVPGCPATLLALASPAVRLAAEWFTDGDKPRTTIPDAADAPFEFLAPWTVGTDAREPVMSMYRASLYADIPICGSEARRTEFGGNPPTDIALRTLRALRP